jgi:PPIC-type PPIASE domain/SurA-like N-terminal domain
MAMEQLRQQSRSFLIWFLFAIIILSFIVTFGPSSMRLSCGASTKAGSIEGRDLTMADKSFALRLGMHPQAPATFRANVYDQLLKREILAAEAERMGISVSEKEITNMIAKRRRVYILGQAADLANPMLNAWPRVRDAEGKLVPAPNYYHDRFKRWVRFSLGMKITAFIEQQRKELLAQRAMEIISNGVIVTDPEAMAIFEYRNHSLELEFARFKVEDFKKGLLVERKDIMIWLAQAENRKKVDALYKKTKWKLTGLAHERRIRHILLKVDAKATDAAKKLAMDKLTKLRVSLEKAPVDFAKMAQLLSTDADTKESGGDLGWREKSKIGYGKEFAEAVFKLKPMTVSPVLKTETGYHLVLVEGDRKGDVKLAAARVWLAEQMLVETTAKTKAMNLAKLALGRLNTGKTMAEVFPPVDGEVPPEDKDEDSESKTPPKELKPVVPKRWHPLLPSAEQAEVKRTDTTIGKVGKVKGLVKKVWALSEAEPVLGEVLTIPGVGTGLGSLVVVRLKSKTVPDKKEFESNKEAILLELLEVKKDDAVKRWVYARCEALRTAGKIKLEKNMSDIEYYAGKGEKRKKQIFKYVPCQRLQRFGRRPGDPSMGGF